MRRQTLWRGLIVVIATVVFVATVQASRATEGVPVKLAVYANSSGPESVAPAVYRSGGNDPNVELVRYGRRWYGGYRGGYAYRPYRAYSYYRPYYSSPYTTYYPGSYYYPGYYWTPGFSYYYGW
jgi:hypothetical protein